MKNNWYPNSLRVLCNGRRAFMGNNLYSKGACYTAQRRKEEQSDAPVYLDETKLTEQISVRMRVNGEEGWYPLVSWGNHWYESDRQFEVLLGDTEDIGDPCRFSGDRQASCGVGFFGKVCRTGKTMRFV